MVYYLAIYLLFGVFLLIIVVAWHLIWIFNWIYSDKTKIFLFVYNIKNSDS